MNTPHYFQLDDVEAIAKAPLHRHILGHEMGCGKMISSILAMQRFKWPRVLIVCPAMVRDAWIKELDSWWPGHPAVGSITLGKGRIKGVTKKQKEARDVAYTAPIQIVSYDLLDQVELTGWGAIFLDELHRCKNAGTGYSKAARALCLANPGAAIVGTTGTLVPDQIIDLWGQLDLIWPGRFGKVDKNGKHSWQFKDRYSNKRHNGYGWDFEGVKDAYLPELRHRLSQVSTRVTKAEIAHLLPPFQVSLLRVKAAKFIPVARQESELELFLYTAAQEKLPHIKEWVDDAVANGTSHVCVLTHLKDSARAIALALETKYGARDTTVFCITGDQPPEHRNRELALAKASKKAIVVATMHSIGIGIDLTWCPQALFAELYWRPETMLQAAGRFSRLSGKVPSSVYMMVLEGTQDEAVANSLLMKFASINAAIQPGDGESKIESALGANVGSEEDFLESLLQFSSQTIDETADLL